MRAAPGLCLPAWLAMSASLVGCTWLEAYPVTRPATVVDLGGPSQSIDLAALLRLAAGLPDMTGARLEAKFADASRRAANIGRPVDRLRVALLLSRPDAPNEDLDQAGQILTELTRCPVVRETNPVLADFASYQLQLIDNRRRQRDELARIRRDAEADRTQLETLKQQLEALKAIEQGIDAGEPAGLAAPAKE